MIYNQWYALLESQEVRTGKPVGVKRLGERLVFWREGTGTVACLRDQCTHRGAALSAGKISGSRLCCPFHGLEFDNSGKCLKIPANGKNAPVPEQFRIKSYEVREAHDFIWVWWGDTQIEYPELPFFEDIEGNFPYLTVQDPWKIHYSRCIENQLDVVHLPFVHQDTIGRGNQTLVNGPKVRVGSDEMNVWVYNENDQGQTPKNPDEIPIPSSPRQYLRFRFPNIWENWLTEKLRIFISFVPVDEENTILYMRFYQKFVTLPLLKWLVCKIGLRFSIKIAHQDRRVVHTQFPRKTELKMKENLIQGDLPIIEYRRRRDELLNRRT